MFSNRNRISGSVAGVPQISKERPQKPSFRTGNKKMDKKWINILKGNVTEPLVKRSEKDERSFDKLSCRSATKFFIKSKFAYS